MNNIELRKKVDLAMYGLIKTNGVASPVELLMAIGVLSKEKYEDWRHGRIPYLERVCQINLGKLSTVNYEIRAFARKNNLKPSWSDYRKWGKGNRTRLRFSKSGDDQIERMYATHYVSQQKVADAQERHEFQKRKNELAQTIAPKGLAGYVLRNNDNNILYSKVDDNHVGSYDDLKSVDAVLKLLRHGN